MKIAINESYLQKAARKVKFATQVFMECAFVARILFGLMAISGMSKA